MSTAAPTRVVVGVARGTYMRFYWSSYLVIESGGDSSEVYLLWLACLIDGGVRWWCSDAMLRLTFDCVAGTRCCVWRMMALVGCNGGIRMWRWRSSEMVKMWCYSGDGKQQWHFIVRFSIKCSEYLCFGYRKRELELDCGKGKLCKSL